MAKQLNSYQVNLHFNANTAQAKMQLQDLQTTLDAIIKESVTGVSQGKFPLTKELTEAQITASKLQTILSQTINMETGKMDLTRFSQSLKQSNLNLRKLQDNLLELGPSGKKAFMSLAQSIVEADVPLKRTNLLVSELWTTLKNTVRWQISSSALHAFMGTIQSAYGYAKDLNESLNHIRIVTGHNIEYMDKFAEKANKAAKALNATTLDYTNASLIYYQQGLSDEEVEKRTDITVKMANVARQSADIVSDQLTAVWNNFYDGSESLEHYADAMVRLGADTASSTDEIAGGLEKFAAVANTIGLSFDNAAAALATITATTRQSEDVVGTSLKTIFARIQGLKLGETLEDGTTLNQYSQALEKVGVNIKDSNGQLKDMDIILDELGHKWTTISKDQQVALAQQVAGIRQYNQLIALMDNFDFYQENIQRAKNADGSLQEQADIYAESWEAARDRVRAAAESIYDDLVDDKFFINLSDAIAGALNGIDNLIDSMGGLPGVLAALGLIFTRVFKNQMTEGINNLAFSLQSLIGITETSAEKVKTDTFNLATSMVFDGGTEAEDRYGQNLKQTLTLKEKIREISGSITAEEKELLDNLIQINKEYGEQALKAAEVKNAASNQLQDTRFDIKSVIRKNALGADRNSQRDNARADIQEFVNVQQTMSDIINVGAEAAQSIDKFRASLSDSDKNTTDFNQNVDNIIEGLKQIGLSNGANDVEKLRDEFNKGIISSEEFRESLNGIITSSELLSDTTLLASYEMEDLAKRYNLTDDQINNLVRDILNLKLATDKNNHAAEESEEAYTKVEEAIKNYKSTVGAFGKAVVSAFNGLSSLAMGLSSLKSIFDTLQNEDMSFFDKLLSVSMSLGMAIPSIVSGVSTLKTSYEKLTNAKIRETFETALNTIIQENNNRVTRQGTIAAGQNAGATTAQTSAENKLTKSLILQTAAWLKVKLGMSATAALGLTIAGIIAAIVAAAAVLVFISKAVYNSIHKEEIAAKAAAQAASDLGKAYDECREKYQQMINEFNEYKDAIDALDNLTKGTQEYRDALDEANQKALELIQNNPDKFTKDDYYWDNDKLVIKDTVMSRVAEASRQETADLYAASTMANANNAQAQANLQRKNLVDTVTGSLRNTTDVDKTIDAYLNSNRVAVDKEDLKDILNLDDGTSSSALVNALWRNIDALNELRSTMDGVETSFDLASKTAAMAQWSGSGKENTKAGKMALEGGGRLYNNLYAEGENTVKGYSLATNWSAYEKMNNLNSLKGYNYSIKGDKVKYSYYDENGEKITQEINKEAVQIAAATQYANDRIGEALDSLYQDIAKANKDGLNSIGKYLSTENFDNMTKGELKQFQGLTDDQLKEYGIDKQAIEEAKKVVFDEIDGLNEAMSDQITVGINKTLKENIQNFGSEGKDAYISAINQIGESIDWNALSPESQAEAWNKISNINWFDFDAQRQAETLIKEMGGDVSTLGDNWDKAFSQMRKAGDVVPVLADIKERLDKIDSITKDMKIGKILEKEDYDTLVNYNSELAKYFAILSDGSAVFVGDPLDFQQMVKSTKQDELSRTINGYQNAIDQYYAGAEELKKAGGLDQIREAGSENVNNQLAFLKTQNYDETQISDWIGKLANSGEQDIDTLKAIAEAVNEVGDSFLSSKDSIEQYTASSQQAMNELAMTTETAQEAEEMLKNGSINEIAYNMSAIQRMSSEKWEDLDSSKVNKYADSLMKTAKNSKLLSDELINNKEAAEDVALYTMKMNNGIEKLKNGFKGWADVLKKSDSASQEYYDAMINIKDAMSDVLGVSEEFLTDEFITENLTDIGKAVKGDADAIDRLAAAASKDILLNVDFVQDNKQLQDALLSMHDRLAAKIPDIKIGTTLEGEDDLIRQAQNIIGTAKMTAEQANAYFSAMGFETKFKVEPQEVEQRTPIVHSRQSIVDIGFKDGVPYWETTTETWNDGYSVQKGYVDAIAMATSPDGTKTPIIESMTRKPSGIMNNSSKINKGTTSKGSNNKPAKGTPSKKSEVVDRYKEITDEIQNLTDAYDAASKAADRLYGKDRLSLMKENNKLVLKEIELLKKKKTEAYRYLGDQYQVGSDRYNLDKAAENLGIKFIINEAGDISNYTEEMTKVYNKLKEAQETYYGFKTKDEQDKFKENTLDELERKINELKDAIKQYDETNKTIEEINKEIQERIYEWQDNNYKELTYKLELDIQVDDNELKALEYYFDKLSNNIYKAAEAFTYLKDQFTPVIQELKDYEDFYNSINAAYNNGEISQSDFIDGMQDSYDSILDNLSALKNLDDQMMEYYGNTLNSANEELSKYTNHMKNLTSILEHYSSIITLLGKDKDYTRVLEVLNGTAQTKKNNFETSKQWYEVLKSEKQEAARALANARDDAEREMLKANFEAIVEKFDEAQEQMLSDAEEYGNALKEILTTKMEEAAKAMEDVMSSTTITIDGTNFNISGWDAIADALDRMSSYQDEYLTKTNQVYEMNKLLNTVNKAIDNTTNQAAKARYNQFTKEIEQLREKDKLSQLELDIAQAKYKVLEAQIALEEAQNAKSMVRLQRDSEGNFGYVYTADQNKLDDAQQQLDDAENDLYNIRLNATNKYGQQKLQYERELAEKLAEIDQKAAEDATYRESAYQQERALIIQQYSDLILASSELFNIAQMDGAEEVTNVVKDAWVNNFEIIKQNGNEWQDAITANTNAINDAFAEWQQKTDIITDLVGDSLDETKEKVEEVTKESNELKEMLSRQMIPTLQREVSAVRASSQAWATQRQQLMQTIRYYENLITKIREAIRLQAQMGRSGGSDGFDLSIDYSALMTEAYNRKDMEAYEKYKKLRDKKMLITDDDENVSNSRIDSLLSHGYNLGVGDLAGYKYYNQIPESWWESHGFATGGYTGNWDGTGKLAFLHQKELVLNAEDTENMLKTIEIVRTIAKSIDLNSAMMAQGLGVLNPTTIAKEMFGQLEQDVHIEANFPNVTNHSEIEEAFNNLINISSQYANRKI